MVGETNLQRMIKKMKLTPTALTIAATIFAGSASAFDPDDLQKLKYTNKCKSCDLSGANLHSTDLSNANLNGANLTEADLRFARLKDADLSNANLKGAILTADLEGAFLNGAILSGANLKGANLEDAILCNTTMPDGSVIYSGC